MHGARSESLEILQPSGALTQIFNNRWWSVCKRQRCLFAGGVRVIFHFLDEFRQQPFILVTFTFAMDRGASRKRPVATFDVNDPSRSAPGVPPTRRVTRYYGALVQFLCHFIRFCRKTIKSEGIGRDRSAMSFGLSAGQRHENTARMRLLDQPIVRVDPPDAHSGQRRDATLSSAASSEAQMRAPPASGT